MEHEELSEETVATMIGNFSDLAREQDQAVAANRAVGEESRRVAAKRIQITAERQRQVSETAGKQAIILDDMGESVERIEEINDSLFLRIIEPLAGAVNPKFSRDKLASGLVNDQRALSVESAKDELKASLLKRRDAVLQSGLDAVQARAAVETGDVSDLAKQIAIHEQSRTSVESLRQQLLLTKSPEELDKFVTAGILTKRQVTQQKRLRESESLSIQQQRAAQQFTEVRLEKAKVEAATDEQLADPKFVAELNVPPQLVVETKQARASQATAWQLQRQSAAANDRVTTISQMQDAELKKLANEEETSEKVSQPEAEEELFIRENRKALAQSRKATAEREMIATKLTANKLWLTHTTLTQLDDLKRRASEGDGIVTVEGPDGLTMTFTNDEILGQFNLKATAEIEQTTIAATGRASKQSAGRAMDEVFMSMGLAVVPGVSLEDKLDSLIRNGDLSPDETDKATDAHAMFEAADNIANPAMKFTMMAQAATLVKEFHQTSIERAVAGKPEALREATKRMITQGGRVNNADALQLITASTATDVHIPSPWYNQALSTIRTSALSLPETANDADRAKFFQEEFTQRDLTPAERIAASSLKKAVQDAAALPVASQMVLQAYAEAARLLGDAGIAADIISGAMFDGGDINNPMLINAIMSKENPAFSITEFVAKVREVVPAVAKRVTAPVGDLDSQGFINSFNQLVFKNVTAYALNIVSDRLEKGLANVKLQNIPGTIGASRGTSGIADFFRGRAGQKPGTDRRVQTGAAEQAAFETGRQ